jgi:DNA repair protein RadC
MSEKRDYKTRIKNISWKFNDVTTAYPELQHARNQKITDPTRFFELFKFLFQNQTQEMFYAFWLNSANMVIGYEMITKGTLNASLAHPREVFRSAIVSSCANIIVAHNHPSGNTEPSNEDIQLTRKLVESGNILDIKIFDHIIFAGDKYTSFVEKRLI